MLAVSARRRRLTRTAYDEAVDAGDLVVAHIVRGAIHVLAPDDLALFGRALVATDDAELARQIGRQFTRITSEHGIAPTAALAEVDGRDEGRARRRRGARQGRTCTRRCASACGRS